MGGEKKRRRRQSAPKPVAPVADPALVAHWPLAVAAVDVQRRGRLVQTGDGAARTQLDDLIGHVPQLEPLQQVNVGHVPVLLKTWTRSPMRVVRPQRHC